jgi:hypothetical protein
VDADVLPTAAATTAAAATATATAVSTTTATTTTAAAAATFGLRPGLVHRNRAAIDFSAIQALNGRTRFGVVAHCHKGKPPWPTRIAIGNHGYFIDLAMGPKLVSQRVFRGGKGKVANIQPYHAQNSKLLTGSAIGLESYKGTKSIGKGTIQGK